jgi:hypothetical protein
MPSLRAFSPRQERGNLALGVIAFEVFTDGRHPIGVTTADVWPWR